jgi:hypothetical protein
VLGAPAFNADGLPSKNACVSSKITIGLFGRSELIFTLKKINSRKYFFHKLI